MLIDSGRISPSGERLSGCKMFNPVQISEGVYDLNFLSGKELDHYNCRVSIEVISSTGFDSLTHCIRTSGLGPVWRICFWDSSKNTVNPSDGFYVSIFQDD